MNDQGAFIAALLDSSRKAYAAGAVLRLQEASPEGGRFVQELGFPELVDDAQVRLQHLAEALACGRPDLFVLDVEWLQETYNARELSPKLIEGTLAALQDELDESLPAGAGVMAREFLQAGLDRLVSLAGPPATLLTEERPHVELAQRFLLAALEGDQGRAQSIADQALADGLGVADLHRHVIVPVQAEVGRMWQTGEIHVAEEHLGSRIVQDILAYLRLRAPTADAIGKTVLIASVAGNLHDIGARIVADHFYMDGWRSIFLGADTPVVDLVQSVRDFEPDLVALSVGLGLNLRAASRTIAAIREASPARVLVGGRAFADLPDLASCVGADASAEDAHAAVAVARELLEIDED